ncbi:MAG: hypothetical protein KatS3mg111_1688 [Pirellulaceae bacterium]|nr:MAG: hypothetical protein KatS3mg111_1688 [Pirellulaceae bacterium]
MVDITIDDLNRLLDRIEQRKLEESDYDLLLKVLRSYDYVMSLLRDDHVRLSRLKRVLFGNTETLKNVIGRGKSDDQAAAEGAETDGAAASEPASPASPAQPGHGRNGADQYQAAREVRVEHDRLRPDDICPECGDGKLYEIGPRVVVRVSGQPPLAATVYRLQRLRCTLCGQLFHAEAPPEAQGQKYDETSAAMIALLKYGSGLPFNRLARLEEALGTPLPPSTQWQIVATYLPIPKLVYHALIHETSHWDLYHNDDTSIKILNKLGLEKPDCASGRTRTGTFTSTVVARREGLDAALFFSGHRHAGENLAAVLRDRPEELAVPIQMCDALSRNMTDELRTIVAHCLAHARRNFVDLVDVFPEETEYVIRQLSHVYRVDAEARRKGLSPQKRLALHRAKSQRVMDGLHKWMTRQLDDRRVEPNSALGQAINYMLKHWERLTQFLRVPGAPLDNNVAERALKKSILHRKNSLYYRSARGAQAGDVYMTLIHTCELNRINPYQYLVALLRHADDVASQPDAWLPWNYAQRQTELAEAGASPEAPESSQPPAPATR